MLVDPSGGDRYDPGGGVAIGPAPKLMQTTDDAILIQVQPDRDSRDGRIIYEIDPHFYPIARHDAASFTKSTNNRTKPTHKKRLAKEKQTAKSQAKSKARQYKHEEKPLPNPRRP
jgi:hypothetical protein